MSFRKRYNQLQTSSLLGSYSSLLPPQPLPSISHHQAHICDNDERVCAGNNIVRNKSRLEGGLPGRMGGGGLALWIINAIDSVRTWQNILLNMLNKAGEGKAVIIWKRVVRLLESPVPTQTEQAVGEEESCLLCAGPSSDHPPLHCAQCLGWYICLLLALCQQFRESRGGNNLF